MNLPAMLEQRYVRLLVGFDDGCVADDEEAASSRRHPSEVAGHLP
jgi:hypothetical protein